MRRGAHRARLIVLAVALIALGGCATQSAYRPSTAADVGYMRRAVSKVEHDVTVTVAVPSPEEAQRLLGFKAGKKGIQAVWIEVKNASGQDYWFMPHALDPEYYSPLEVAWMGRKSYTKDARYEMQKYLFENAMPPRVPAGETIAGYAFVNQTLGARRVVVELIGDQEGMLTFDFLVPIPGLSTDFRQVDVHSLYDSFEDLDLEGLRRWLEEQPATVANQKKTKLGDPLNIVVVGTEDAVWPAFARAGWHVTETMSASATWRTIKSSVFGKRYLYSPISALYVYDRPQDIALQKPRATVDERNHLRLWLTPVTYKGQPVMLGQISRDIGVRFTTKSPTISTHKIDPDVDETRGYLIQDLAYAQGLSAFAFVKGVGASPIDAPRGNLTGDPYFTDGLRVVMFMTKERTPIDRVKFIKWEVPP